MTREVNLANFHAGELRPISPGRPENPLDIVAIGASADGVNVISDLLEQLPHNLAAAILVVLHRPIERVSHLHHILARRVKLRVVVPEEGQRLKKGCCFLSEPQQHLTISPSLRIHLLPDSFYRSHNIDALFCSLARHAGRRTISTAPSASGPSRKRAGSHWYKARKKLRIRICRATPSKLAARSIWWDRSMNLPAKFADWSASQRLVIRQRSCSGPTEYEW
jgi:hypothetical protein